MPILIDTDPVDFHCCRKIGSDAFWAPGIALHVGKMTSNGQIDKQGLWLMQLLAVWAIVETDNCLVDLVVVYPGRNSVWSPVHFVCMKCSVQLIRSICPRGVVPVFSAPFVVNTANDSSIG